MSVWHRIIHPITHSFRRRRGRFMLKYFPEIGHQKICDLGGSIHFWDKLGLPVPDEHITIYNVTSEETQGMHPVSQRRIDVRLYDGKRIPVPDRFFDLLVCNSVLEHVPPGQRAALAAEMRRVARSVFCQTPARSFPIEPHFLMPFVHWLPRRLGFLAVHVSPWRLLSRPAASTIREYWWGTELLDKREVEGLFPGALVIPERVLGLTKSYYVVWERAALER